MPARRPAHPPGPVQTLPQHLPTCPQDGGATWGPLQVVARNSSLLERKYQNWGQPTALVDKLKRRVLLLSTLNNLHVRVHVRPVPFLAPFSRSPTLPRRRPR